MKTIFKSTLKEINNNPMNNYRWYKHKKACRTLQRYSNPNWPCDNLSQDPKIQEYSITFGQAQIPSDEQIGYNIKQYP